MNIRSSHCYKSSLTTQAYKEMTIRFHIFILVGKTSPRAAEYESQSSDFNKLSSSKGVAYDLL